MQVVEHDRERLAVRRDPVDELVDATVAGTPGVRSRASAMRPRPGRTRSTAVATYVQSRTGSLSPAVERDPRDRGVGVLAPGLRQHGLAEADRRVDQRQRRGRETVELGEQPAAEQAVRPPAPAASFVSIRGSASGTPAAAGVALIVAYSSFSARERPAHPGEFDGRRLALVRQI